MGLLKGMGVAMKSQPILPLYQKLAEDLKSQIEDGSLKDHPAQGNGNFGRGGIYYQASGPGNLCGSPEAESH